MSKAPTKAERTTAREMGTFQIIRRLVAEHGREHFLAYAAAAALMAVAAVATGLSVSLLRPVLNGMMAANDFKHLRFLAFATAGLYMVRGIATFGQLVLMSRTGNRIVAT